ncbi:MAG: alpha/beta hydrolase family protein [Gaiellales bacterium]
MIGGYYARQLLEPVRFRPAYELEVLALAAGTVTLPRTDDLTRDGVWGIEWPDGYAQAGRLVEAPSATVTRELLPIEGELRVGELVASNVYAYPPDPARAHGLAFSEVGVTSPLGKFPAWEIEGGDSWAIFVHGRGATREEALRILPSLVASGCTTLVITYRNDEGTPAGRDGLYHLGAEEWLDVQAAVDHARGRGARRLVLAASSMGGAIVGAFLSESSDARLVVALILDAPVLDWNAVVEQAARRRGVPRPLMWLGRRAAERRIGVRLASFDQVGRAGDLTVPVLLLHGADDRTVPVGPSRALAAARPDLVTLVEVAGAGHAQAWNRDPAAYDRHVRSFLAGILG